MMTALQMVREIARHGPAELALLLGAGASKSSGIPLAWEMIAEWRADLFDAQASAEDRARLALKDWLAANAAEYPWFGTDAEYSKLFELRYRSPSRRQKYIEQKVEGVRPGWGYLYLADLVVSERRFTTIFTTNFDDLVHDALSAFLRHNAVVCNADSEVDQISFLSERAKIIKLHGDYLFADIRNTEEELRALGTRMADKFSELARQRGLVVLGYAGRDQSVMSMIETLLKEPRNFPHSIYWGLLPGEKASAWVARLAQEHADRFEIFEFPGFDAFMADLHTAFKLELPAAVVSPRLALDAELAALVAKGSEAAQHALVHEHSSRLQALLGRPVDAELALARRDYRQAIALVLQYIDKRGTTGPALTVWANALSIQADEEGREDLLRDAIAKLAEAIELEPAGLQQRYGIASLYMRRRMASEAITAFEVLRDKVPKDSGVRRALVDLYMKARKFSAAETELAWLREREPRAADVAAMQGMVLLARGYMAQAAVQLRAATELDPGNPYLHGQLAEALANMRQTTEAEAAYKQACTLAGDNVMFLLALANFYLRAVARPADAVPLLERAAKIDPNSSEARGLLGELYLGQGRLADAERETAAAVNLQPTDARLLNNLGLIHLHAQREQEAEQMLLRARDANASLPEPHNWLCLLYARQGRGPELMAELQAVGRLMPQQAQWLDTQARAVWAQAAQMRASGLPFDWRPVFQMLAGGGAPVPRA